MVISCLTKLCIVWWSTAIRSFVLYGDLLQHKAVYCMVICCHTMLCTVWWFTATPSYALLYKACHVMHVVSELLLYIDPCYSKPSTATQSLMLPHKSYKAFYCHTKLLLPYKASCCHTNLTKPSIATQSFYCHTKPSVATQSLMLPHKALCCYTKPSVATQGLLLPCKAFCCHTKPYVAIQSFLLPHKAFLPSPTKPYDATQSPLLPYKALCCHTKPSIAIQSLLLPYKAMHWWHNTDWSFQVCETASIVCMWKNHWLDSTHVSTVHSFVSTLVVSIWK